MLRSPHTSFASSTVINFFESQSRSPLTSLNANFSIINLFCHSFITHASTYSNQLSTFFFILSVISSLVPATLCIFSIRIRSAKLTPHILRRDSISITFFFLSFFFCNTHVSLPYNSVGTNTALCIAKRAAVLTFRRFTNADKVP